MANLIGFDKNRDNVEFRGPCKLSINFMSKYLFVEPKNEAFKLISASFKWNYVMKKNLLFVFAEHNFLDFCLVFMNEQICKKTYNYIASGKDDTEITNEEHSIDDGFITPIFQRIAENPTFQASMIETIATWHHLLDDDDKQKYSQMMMDYGMNDMIIAAISIQQESRQDVTVGRKRKFLKVKKEVMPKIEMEREYANRHYVKIISSFQFQCMKFGRYRKLFIFTSDKKKGFHEYRLKSKCDEFQCISCDQIAVIDIDEKGEICVMLENNKHSCKLSTQIPSNYQNVKIVEKQDYKIFENCAKYSAKVLVVFASEDRSQCYEYSWSESNSTFYCRGCLTSKLPNKSSAFIFNEGTSKEYVGIINGNHECKKRKYTPEKLYPIYDYVLKPNFEIQQFFRNGKERKRLVIYDSNDRRKCYRYFYRSDKEKFCCYGCFSEGNYVTAKLHQNSENEEYIILSNVKHICEMKTSVPVNKVIYRPPEIEIMEETKNGKPRVFLFENGDRSKCYTFIEQEKSRYYCVGCKSKNDWNRKQKKPNMEVKNVRGNLLKEENGEYFFQMKSNSLL